MILFLNYTIWYNFFKISISSLYIIYRIYFDCDKNKFYFWKQKNPESAIFVPCTAPSSMGKKHESRKRKLSKYRNAR